MSFGREYAHGANGYAFRGGWYRTFGTLVRYALVQPVLCKVGEHDWVAGERVAYCPTCGFGMAENFEEES